MNWGKGIIVAFVLFFGVIFTLAYISINTEFSLVADNYYEQELAYEDQLVRIRNLNGLEEQPTFSIDRNALTVQVKFTESLARGLKSGKVKFYRASGAKFDKEMELKLDEQHIFEQDIAQFVTGAWKLQMTWSDGDKEYYKEVDFVI